MKKALKTIAIIVAILFLLVVVRAAIITIF